MLKEIPKTISMAFDYEIDRNDNVLDVSLSGRIMTSEEGKELLEEIELQMNEGDIIIASLKQLEYINSTGLNSLVNVLTKSRNSGGDFYIVEVSEKIKGLFIITKLNTVFNIMDSREEVVQSLQTENS